MKLIYEISKMKCQKLKKLKKFEKKLVFFDVAKSKTYAK